MAFKQLLCILFAFHLGMAAMEEDPLRAVAFPAHHLKLSMARLLDYNQNMCYSLLAVEMAMGMVLKAAGGKTAEEIRRALHFGNDSDSEIHSKLHKVNVYFEITPANSKFWNFTAVGVREHHA